MPYETATRTLNASPRHMSASPVQRYSPNSNYITTATHRMSPSTTVNKVRNVTLCYTSIYRTHLLTFYFSLSLSYRMVLNHAPWKSPPLINPLRIMLAIRIYVPALHYMALQNVKDVQPHRNHAQIIHLMCVCPPLNLHRLDVIAGML